MAVSWKNKLVGAIATGAIVAGLFPMGVLAAPPDLYLDTNDDPAVEATETAPAIPAGPAYKLTVDGLAAGDTTTFYQIVEQDVDSYEKAAAPFVAGETYYTRTGTDPDYTYTKVDNPVADDLVNYYVVKTGSQQWKLHDNVAEDVTIDGETVRVVKGTSNATFNEHKGLRVEDLLIKRAADDTSEEAVGGSTDTRVLTKDMVNAISSALSNNASKVPAYKKSVAQGSTKVEFSDNDGAEAGMYMVVAVPGEGNTDYIYKPIFVSADYYNSVSKPEDNTHIITLQDDVTDYSGDPKVFKRSPLQVDKKSGKYNEDGTPIDMQNDVAVGDTVDFTITVPMPTYSTNYTAPQFYITDKLTEGLELVPTSVQVSVKQEGANAPELATKDKDYKVLVNQDIDKNTIRGFTVQFYYEDTTVDGPDEGTDPNNDKDGILYRVTGAPTVTITYKATVTSSAAQQVNQMDNTVTLNYSKNPNYYDASTYDDPDDVPELPTTPNEPNPDEPTSELKDRTRHYTFDIDGDILGPKQGVGDDGQPLPGDDDENHNKTSEIRKVWLDAAGNEVKDKQSAGVTKGTDGTETVTGDYDWLDGAVFKLVQTKRFVTTVPTKENPTAEPTDANFVALETPTVVKFNDKHVRDANGTKDPTSDANGYIAMKGLDAGVYELTETKAPLGYTFNPNVKYTITITPYYVLEKAATTADPTLTTYDGKDSGDDLILKSYKVEIVTQQLKDNLDIDGNNTVTTTTTYTVGDDTTGNPISFLNTKDTVGQDGQVAPGDAEGDFAEPAVTSITISTDAKSAMIINKKLGFLPATGGSGIIFYLAVGGAVAALASYLLKNTKEEDPLA